MNTKVIDIKKAQPPKAVEPKSKWVKFNEIAKNWKPSIYSTSKDIKMKQKILK